MSAIVAYTRISTDDQTCENQRNTIDALCTVEALKAKGVSVVSMREGFVPAYKLMLTMPVAVAELERENFKARQLTGLERTRAEGKHLGRTNTIDDAAVIAWRTENAARIKTTAEHFGISTASVKRACAKS